MFTHKGIKPVSLLLSLLCLMFTPACASAQPMIVAEGQPKAEIVTNADAPRVIPIAAKELQSHIQQITGATLPIVHQPTGGDTLAIYIGQSAHTDKLGVTTEGLIDGAFRIVSGDNWLVLIGQDDEYAPKGPFAMQTAPNHPDRQRVMDEWDKLSGGKWGNPFLSYNRSFHKGMNLSSLDKRGSLNAVHQFLRDLGVEWYMPGELGQITPKMNDIPLPKGDRTINPDFGWRIIHAMGITFGTQKEEDILWALRLGGNGRSEAMGIFELQSHGLRDVMRRDELKQAHPEYYALWGNKRMTEGNGKPCLSSPGLVDEAVRYVRAVFDVYDVPMASVMPQDGYGRACQCELCEGKETPERGMHGSMSDYVFEFVNKVATEVYKTHPDRKISCYAYGTYLLPPTNISKLSPNVVVGIVHGRSAKFRDPATRGKLKEIREGWLNLTSHPLLGWEHYVFTHRGTIWPSYFPREIAADLKMVKGETHGEVVEVAWAEGTDRLHALDEPGFNHLNVFTTARYWWDADQDIDAFLDRYYQDFYGPAAAPMKAFIEASRGYWMDMQTNHERIPGVLELFEKAKAAAPADSVYAQRIALVDEYLIPLRNLRDQLAKGRENIPEARVANARGQTITLDGKLDEEVWKTAASYGLRELTEGKKPDVATSFQTAWVGGPQAGSLYIAIRCQEPDMKNMPVKIKPDGSNPDGIWMSDNIELLIETQGHSYYQIVIAPNGQVFDMDRRGGMNAMWKSGIQVASHQGENEWVLEIRIPVLGSDTADDPNHDLVGKRPTEMYPWHINVCRQRLRDSGNTFYAWSPTGTKGFHQVMRFGKLAMR